MNSALSGFQPSVLSPAYSPEISWRSPIPSSQSLRSASWVDLSRPLLAERESDPITDDCKFGPLLPLLLEVPVMTSQRRSNRIRFLPAPEAAGLRGDARGRCCVAGAPQKWARRSEVSRRRFLGTLFGFVTLEAVLLLFGEPVSPSGRCFFEGEVLQDLAPLGFPS